MVGPRLSLGSMVPAPMDILRLVESELAAFRKRVGRSTSRMLPASLAKSAMRRYGQQAMWTYVLGQRSLAGNQAQPEPL